MFTIKAKDFYDCKYQDVTIEFKEWHELNDTIKEHLTWRYVHPDAPQDHKLPIFLDAGYTPPINIGYLQYYAGLKQWMLMMKDIHVFFDEGRFMQTVAERVTNNE